MTALPANDPLICDHGLRRQAIVQSLLADVFQGRLAAGQHLVTQELADRFGVSHTPIREALIALAGIGIIDLLPNRGAVVRRGHRAARSARSARSAACWSARPPAAPAAGSTWPSCTPWPTSCAGCAVVAGLIGRFIAEARAVDSRLHDLIAASCGNAFLAKELGRLKMLFRAFRDVAWEHDEARNDYRRLAEEAGEHLAIVEALLAGDATAAAAAMARHIRSGVEVLEPGHARTTDHGRRSATESHTEETNDR